MTIFLRRMTLIRCAGFLLAGLLLVSCATVPETGRRQLRLVNAQEEMQLGLTEFQKLKKSTPISQDAAINELVQRVGQRIAAVAALPDAKWEFVVFDQPKTANAFCLPGGKVGVFTGILPITKDETGLATVIGHEVAHAVAHHGAERISEGLLVQLGGQVLGEAMKNNSESAREIALAAFGLGGTVGVMLPHSREQETEADDIGLIYMARAGYDPRNAVEFWKRFATYNAKSGGTPMQFLSTHPVDSVRIRNLETRLPAALAEYEKSQNHPR
jgi:predicted Zn-dependent protease